MVLTSSRPSSVNSIPGWLQDFAFTPTPSAGPQSQPRSPGQAARRAVTRSVPSLSSAGLRQCPGSWAREPDNTQHMGEKTGLQNGQGGAHSHRVSEWERPHGTQFFRYWSSVLSTGSRADYRWWVLPYVGWERGWFPQTSELLL